LEKVPDLVFDLGLDCVVILFNATIAVILITFAHDARRSEKDERRPKD
jgi:hypothetical protein